jgi:hypothetical protein
MHLCSYCWSVDHTASDKLVSCLQVCLVLLFLLFPHGKHFRVQSRPCAEPMVKSNLHSSGLVSA